MISSTFDNLASLDGVVLHPPVSPEAPGKLLATHGVRLPRAHVAILERSNGVEAYGGYVRCFGLHTADTLDAAVWNEPEFWKFAWGDRCAGYWCFGETAWGDQYAYRLDDLGQGADPDVYFLDCVSMAATQIDNGPGDGRIEAIEPYEDLHHRARLRLVWAASAAEQPG